MRRPLALVLLLIALLALTAAPAAGDRPKQQIIDKRLTFGPGETGILEIDCPEGYKAVAGFVVEREAGISVYYSFEDTKFSQSSWIFRVLNRGTQGASLRAEVRCVKVRELRTDEEIAQLYSEDQTGQVTLDPGERERLIARCPPGDAPLGWGFQESAPGPPRNDPPSVLAASRLATVRPSPGRMTFMTEGTGFEPVAQRFFLQCIDRHIERPNFVADFAVIRREVNGAIDAGEDTRRLFRCPSVTVPASPGWVLPPETSTFAEPFDLSGSGTVLGLFNATPNRHRFTASHLCLNQNLRRR